MWEATPGSAACLEAPTTSAPYSRILATIQEPRNPVSPITSTHLSLKTRVIPSTTDVLLSFRESTPHEGKEPTTVRGPGSSDLRPRSFAPIKLQSAYGQRRLLRSVPVLDIPFPLFEPSRGEVPNRTTAWSAEAQKGRLSNSISRRITSAETGMQIFGWPKSPSHSGVSYSRTQ